MAELDVAYDMQIRTNSEIQAQNQRLARTEQIVAEVCEDVIENRRNIGMNRVVINVQGKRLSMAEEETKVLGKKVKGLEKISEELKEKGRDHDACFYILSATTFALLGCIAKESLF